MSISEDVISMVRDPFLNTEEACGYLGVPKATLLTWRVRRPGYRPLALKAGGRLKCRLSGLHRCLSAHEGAFSGDPDSDEDPSREVVRTRRRASRVRGAALGPTDPR